MEGGSRPEGGRGSSGQPGPLQSPLKWPEGTWQVGRMVVNGALPGRGGGLTMLRLLQVLGLYSGPGDEGALGEAGLLSAVVLPGA